MSLLKCPICNNNPFIVFSYPAVYIICILPKSIDRWIYFNGSEVPYQFTLYSSTLFSFCGLFDAILFFLTRPNLVIGNGTTDSPALPPTGPVSNTQPQLSGDVELPFTRSPTASDYIPLNVERGRNSQFQSYNQILHPEGAGNSYTSTRDWRQSDLAYLDEDEEEYGHLPIR